MPVRKSGMRCILCGELYQYMDELHEHYVKLHDVDSSVKTLSFSSMREFLEWIKKFEDSTVTRFRLKTNTKNKRTLVLIYMCYRSGTYTLKSSNRK